MGHARCSWLISCVHVLPLVCRQGCTCTCMNYPVSECVYKNLAALFAFSLKVSFCFNRLLAFTLEVAKAEAKLLSLNLTTDSRDRIFGMFYSFTIMINDNVVWKLFSINFDLVIYLGIHLRLSSIIKHTVHMCMHICILRNLKLLGPIQYTHYVYCHF